MAKKEVKVGIKFDDNGSLKETGKKGKQAGADLNKGAKGAHSMDRRLKGAAQASSNSTKNFSKMSQGISGGLVPAYATLAASLFAVDALFRALKRGSDLRVQQQGMVAYAQSTGMALKTMTANLQAATGGQLDFKEAAESVSIASAAGFNADQITAIGKAAKQASITLGRDFTDSYQRMIKGITKAEPELLDELGIILRLDDAMAKHSTIIGKSAEDFTAFERQTAVLNEVMRQTAEKFGAVGDNIPVNVMTQLGAKFTDISDGFLTGIAPIAEFFGGVLVNSTQAAIAAMGIFAASILKQVIPSADAMIVKMRDAAIARKAAFADMKGSGSGMYQGIKGAFSSASATTAAGNIAKSDLKDVKSKGLDKLRSGGAMTGAQKGGLKRALKQAEKQYADHGRIVTGMFKGKDAATLKSLRLTLTAMEGGWKGFVAKTKLGTGQLVRSFKIGTTVMKAVWKTTTAVMSAGAAKLGRAMNSALGIIGWIGMLFMAKDMFAGMADQWDKILIKIGQGIAKIGGFMVKVAGYLGPLGWGMKKVGEGLEYTGNKMVEKGEKMKDAYDEKRAKTRRKAFIKTEKERMTSMMEEVNTIASKIEGPGNKASQLLGDVGGGGTLKGFKSLEKKGYLQSEIKELTNKQIEHFKALAKLDPAYQNVIELLENDQWDKAADQADKITKGHATHTAALKDLSSTQDGFNKSIAKALLKNKAIGEFGLAIVNSHKSLSELGNKDSIETLTTMKDTIENMFGEEAANNINTYAEGLAFMSGKVSGLTADVLLLAQAELAVTQARSGVSQATGGIAIAGGYAQREARSKAADLAATAARGSYNEHAPKRIEQLAQETEGSDGYNAELARQASALLNVENLEKVSERYKMLKSDLGELAMAGTQAFADGMQSGIEGIITGTKSLGDAFKGMAKSILASLAKIIAKQLMMKMLMGAFGGTDFGNFLGLESPAPKARYGGVMSSPGYRSFNTGGVATGPQSGYTATLHGTEAVVPLGSGRSIPVEMKGGSGSTNNTNVVVNVAQDGQTNTQVSGVDRGAAMGNLIASAIEERLRDEQRPGGMLNPGGG